MSKNVPSVSSFLRPQRRIHQGHYIGRRFRNDTERLEKRFELYTRMTAAKQAPKAKKPKMQVQSLEGS